MSVEEEKKRLILQALRAGQKLSDNELWGAIEAMQIASGHSYGVGKVKGILEFLKQGPVALEGLEIRDKYHLAQLIHDRDGYINITTDPEFQRYFPESDRARRKKLALAKRAASASRRLSEPAAPAPPRAAETPRKSEGTRKTKQISESRAKKLREAILAVSSKVGSDRLVYDVHFWFGCSVSVKIGDVELNQNREYGFKGWNEGIGELDLSCLVREGFLRKISEEGQSDDTERTKEYEIVRPSPPALSAPQGEARNARQPITRKYSWDEFVNLVSAQKAEKCPACNRQAYNCWTKLTGDFEAQLIQRGEFAEASKFIRKNGFTQYHPDDTSYWHPDAPIALAFYPYHASRILTCDACNAVFLAYLEDGGHGSEERCRWVQSELLVLKV